jgi:excisionase family DNA binding protein
VGATRLDRLEYVARKLDVTVETLRESLRAGTLPGVKIGSMWCVDPEQIVLALNRSAEQPPFGQPAGVGGIRHVAKIPQYVPIKEVARKLDVHVETLRRMLRSNELPGTKVHNVWRVDPEQIVLALSRSANK